MHKVQVLRAPKSFRIEVTDRIQNEIKSTFKRIVGPIVPRLAPPKGSFIVVNFLPVRDERHIDVIYRSTSPMPQEAAEVVKDAAILADIGAYNWSFEAFDVWVPFYEISAHQGIERLSQISQARDIENARRRTWV